jgi:hypothetical protein
MVKITWSLNLLGFPLGYLQSRLNRSLKNVTTSASETNKKIKIYLMLVWSVQRKMD